MPHEKLPKIKSDQNNPQNVRKKKITENYNTG